MPKSARRYDLYLPLTHNDGRPIADEVLLMTLSGAYWPGSAAWPRCNANFPYVASSGAGGAQTGHVDFRGLLGVTHLLARGLLP